MSFTVRVDICQRLCKRIMCLTKFLTIKATLRPNRYVRHAKRENFRCLWRLGPPLTISNREVKPTCADGTALLRVGEYVDANFKP